VLVDAVADGAATARSAAEAPQIDGVVRIATRGKPRAGEKNVARLRPVEKNVARLRAGEWADVELTGADTYDLTGRLTVG
jgi:hypothetical protein